MRVRSSKVRTVALAAVLASGVLAVGVASSAHRAPAPLRFELQPGVILPPSAQTGTRLVSCPASECYDPAQLRAAYDLAPLYAKGVKGQHETIVIVDAFGSPTIQADLHTFDVKYGIPAPPSFKVITPEGKISAYSPTAKDRFGWAVETSLDVEWSHAMAPGAAILLVETPTDEVEGTSGFPDIMAAERYVITHKLGTEISQSFTATEQTFTSESQLTPFRSAFTDAQKADVSVLAGSGDLGATDYESNASTIYPYRVVSWPATDPLVTAVGGTKLDLNAAGAQLLPAVVWNDTYQDPSDPSPSASGGGTSEFFGRPSYQSSVASVTGSARGVPDISMSAACSARVAVYVSANHGAPGWEPICGTSEATPLFAAIVALADQEAGHGLGLLNPALYALSGTQNSGIVPVTSGNNTVAFRSGDSDVTVTGYAAGTGYNLAAGLGTINAAEFVPALVREWKILNPKK
jgi:subtilase family serine protease